MKMTNLLSAVLVSFAIGFAGGPSGAQDFAKGLAAARSGDFETAIAEWRPLAEQGNPTAQYNLGVMYENGEGVPQDYVEAARWYRLAAEQGVASAQNNLGGMFFGGKGVPQDFSEAVRWYRLAAEQGEAVAQNNLGGMYFNGQGVIQDTVYAHMWFNIAASQGHESAMQNRETAAQGMTADDISKAQRIARECVAKAYKGC